ncbi:hypothetical protein Gpo141_00005315 [Globisporangium polare]
MTISKRIRSELFVVSAPAPATAAPTETVLIRLPLNRPLPGARKRPSRAKKSLLGQQQHDKRGLGWSDEEHERFLRGLEKFPTGPWKAVAEFVGTRTTRQVMTHAQKYRQKIARRLRGLQTQVQRKPAPIAPSVQSSCGDGSGDDEAMAAPVTKTSTAAEPAAQVDVKLEKGDLFTRHIPTIATCGLDGNSLSATLSPSSIDHASGAFDFFSSNANVALSTSNAGQGSPYYNIANFLPVVGMAADESRLANDELCVEALWVNTMFDECDDHVLMLSLQQDDDPLALMFQDPLSFSSVQHSNKSALLAMDAVYPPAAMSMWTPAASHNSIMETSAYVYQL